MSFIYRFLVKNSVAVFFIFLQVISIVLIFSKNSMQRSFLASNVSVINAFVAGVVDEGTSYLKLKQVNEDLVAQNKELMYQLYGKVESDTVKLRRVNNISEGQTYSFIEAEIIQNSINRNNNYFIINRGKRHGISTNMGVIAPVGIAGIVINTTDNYSLVQSVLSTSNIKINTELKKSNYFGTLTWDGADTRIMHLSDIPKYVPIKIGDTVVTGGKSSVFPKGIMIGKVAGYEVDTSTGDWKVSVELSQKMGQAQKVFVVNNMKKVEIKEIEEILEDTIKEENDK